MIYLVIVPLVAALGAFLVPETPRGERFRPWIVAAAGSLHTALTILIIATRADDLTLAPWLQLDALGRLILAVMSVIFLLCSCYSIGYLRVRSERPNRIFCIVLLVFLAMT